MTRYDDLETLIGALLADLAPDDIPDRVLRATFDQTRVLPQLPARGVASGWRIEPRSARIEGPRVRSLQGSTGGWATVTVVAVVIAALAFLAVWRSREDAAETGSPVPPSVVVSSTSPAPASIRLPASGPPSGDLLEDVRAAGRLRIAVPRPAAGLPVGGAAYQLAIAEEIGRRMGIPMELVPTPPDQIFIDSTAAFWDAAYPVEAIPTHSHRYSASSAYAELPRYLVAPRSGPVRSVAELTGRRICAVAGSSGADWLADQLHFVSPTDVVTPPANYTLVTSDSDAGCLAALASGHADAVVTVASLRGDIEAVAGMAIVGPVLFHEGLEIVVPATSQRLDTRPILDQIDRQLQAMRRDGTLGDLARSAFGGVDVSVAGN